MFFTCSYIDYRLILFTVRNIYRNIYVKIYIIYNIYIIKETILSSSELKNHHITYDKLISYALILQTHFNCFYHLISSVFCKIHEPLQLHKFQPTGKLLQDFIVNFIHLQHFFLCYARLLLTAISKVILYYFNKHLLNSKQCISS